MHFRLVIFLLFVGLAVRAQPITGLQLAHAAEALTQVEVVYDPSYFRISYPNGDVPYNKGVCTDVVIRAYRKTGIDLQQRVHEDMEAHFNLYPNTWGLKKTDSNIDHRRVPNLMTFFGRFGTKCSITQNSAEYLPGDIVCWNLGGGITHIGLVSSKSNDQNTGYLIVHNVGAGQVLENFLFNYPIIGHYRYAQKKEN